uniref:Uncharacterized protein n=1 Tax=Cacopsylla melanoneura TaxID=428564 RepID=A0A8D9AP36_9HEMI
MISFLLLLPLHTNSSSSKSPSVPLSFVSRTLSPFLIGSKYNPNHSLFDSTPDLWLKHGLNPSKTGKNHLKDGWNDSNKHPDRTIFVGKCQNVTHPLQPNTFVRTKCRFQTSVSSFHPQKRPSLNYCPLNCPLSPFHR